MRVCMWQAHTACAIMTHCPVSTAQILTQQGKASCQAYGISSHHAFWSMPAYMASSDFLCASARSFPCRTCVCMCMCVLVCMPAAGVPACSAAALRSLLRTRAFRSLRTATTPFLTRYMVGSISQGFGMADRPQCGCLQLIMNLDCAWCRVQPSYACSAGNMTCMHLIFPVS